MPPIFVPKLTPPLVLSFAASDPTGGAGIQADLLTLAAWAAIRCRSSPH